MILKRLRIDRLPGIADAFELTDLGAGLNVVLGPNASGKSSLCRAVRALLYGEPVDGQVLLEAEFEDAQGSLRVERQGDDVRWTRHGQRVDAPPLPEQRMRRCFTVHLEDLLSDETTERAMGDRIGKILAGGYDLYAVREEARFRIGQRHAKKESEALRKAAAAADEAGRIQLELLDEERRLEDLRSRKHEATRAETRVAPIETALELLRHREELNSAEARLSAFPEGMERLDGKERERLDSLADRLRDQHQAVDDLDGESADATRSLELSRLDGDEPDEAAVAERRIAVGELRAIEANLANMREALADATSRRDEAARSLGGEPSTSGIRIRPSDVSRAEEGLSGKRKLDAEIQALEEQISNLGADSVEDAELDRIQRMRDALLDWLGAPDWSSVKQRATRPWVVLLSLIALGGIAVAAWILHWAFLFVALPAVLATVILLLPPPAPDDRRGKARSAYGETGLGEPEVWEPGAVRDRLDALQGKIAAAKRAQIDTAQRGGLERRLETKRVEANEIAEDLRRLATEVGFDPGELGASLERWIRLVEKHDNAGDKIAELEEKRRTMVEQSAALRTELREFLERHGEAPDAKDAGAERLGDRLERLEGRRNQRDEARRTLDRNARARERALKALERTREEIDAVYVGAGLSADDDAALTRQLELLEEWKQARKRRDDSRAVLSDTKQRLGDEPALLALIENGDEDALKRAKKEAEDLAAERDALSKTITTIENAVRDAGAGHALEDAQERVTQAVEALQDRLEEERFAAIGRFLLDDVESEHVGASRPTVLRDAERWFERFTRNAFVLKSRGRRDETFLVRETATAEDRTPDQLSSGTRMQLFLALRLAFALDAERGKEPLPLFLDEALTITDPERFRAVATCIEVFAREGERQVFYLTAQPHDVAGWAALGGGTRLIRLHEVRRLASAMPDTSGLALPALEEVPSSEGLTDEEYGARLQVPRVEIWDAAERVHVFHLLRDRLPLLRQLLQQGIRHVGPLRSLLDSEAAEIVLTREERDELDWRSALVEPLLVALRRGRGRPVDREVLEAAAVSATFLPRLEPLLAELEGDGAALLAAIDAKRVKGFQTKQRDQLRSYFVEHGHIDARDTLGAEEIGTRMLGVAAAAVANGTTTQARVAELTRFLLATARVD